MRTSITRLALAGRRARRRRGRRRRGDVDVRQPAVEAAQGEVRIRAHEGMARPGPPRLGALHGRGLGLLRLARRPHDHEPPRGPRLHPERLERRERLREERLLRRHAGPGGGLPGLRGQRPHCDRGRRRAKVLGAREGADVRCRGARGAQGRDRRDRERVQRGDRPALQRGDASTRAASSSSTSTRSTRTCASCSPPSSRSPSSAATPTTSPSPATTSTSA